MLPPNAEETFGKELLMGKPKMYGINKPVPQVKNWSKNPFKKGKKKAHG
jgi:hypothetical protein